MPSCNKQMDELDGRDAILIIGDSVSLGYTPVVRDNLSSYQVIHNSCNAMSTKNGVKNIDKWISHNDSWKVCTINHGLWDINPKYKVGVEQYVNNLEYEVDKLLLSCDKVIFMNTTMVDRSRGGHRNPLNVTIYNEHARILMQRMNVPVCDLNTVSHSAADKLIDPVHYNQDGYKILGDAVTDCINNL